MNPYASNVQKAIFEIEVDVSGNIRPLDAKKLAGDDSASQHENMCDALFHRLTCQIQSSSDENGTTIFSAK